jgi:hypothetical protein
LGDLDKVVSQSCRGIVIELVGQIWQDLLRQLTAPIVVQETQEQRIVTLLDSVRFLVSKRSGRITVKERWTYPRAVKWKAAEGKIAVALPLPPTGAWLHAWLSRWWPAFADAGLTTCDVSAVCKYLAPRLDQALLRSIWWRRLRRDAGAALQLDAEVIRYCRLAKAYCPRSEVSASDYNALLNKRAACREIHADNPRLLWLYMLMLNEGISLPGAGVVAAMKKALLAKGQLPPIAWRLLVNGHPRDFHGALDFVVADGRIKTPLGELCACLSLMVKLGRTHPVPLEVQQLWLHDWFEYDERKEQFWFRGANFDRSSFRLLLDEAERRLKQGTLQEFAEGELVDVVTFLSFEPMVLDANQSKAGWRWLVKRAMEWRAMKEEHRLFQSGVCWDSLLEAVDVGDWTVEPVTNAWAARRLAMQQHNCVHSYIDDCVRGGARLFQVRSHSGKVIATVGIIRSRNLWKLFDVRGFANAQVEAGMRELGKDIARLYGRLWLQASQSNRSGSDEAVLKLWRSATLSTIRITVLMRKKLGEWMKV